MLVKNELPIALPDAGPTGTAPATGTAGSERFAEMLERYMDSAGHREMAGVSERLKAGELLPNTELLRYQIQMHELSMKTELVSKAGEAVTGTLRRLQQPG